MIDTGDTLSLATTTLHENGAEAIFVLVSHCTMQSNLPSLQKLARLPIARLVVTNTLPQTHLMQGVNEETKKVTDGVTVESPTTLNGYGQHHYGVNGVNGINGVNGTTSISSASSTTSDGYPLANGTSQKPVKSMGGNFTVLDISPLLAESIRRTHNGESISLLFGDWAERTGMAGYL
jgi:phosphoribosylpyrophosphate synthetase